MKLNQVVLGVVSCAALLCTCAVSARAGEGNYQAAVIGDRAAGMGGAFISLANEATGAYYNPAGIVVERSTLIQVSMSAWRWRKKETTVGTLCGRKFTEDESAFFGFPASLGLVKLFSTGKVRHAIGLQLIVPEMSKTSQANVERNANCQPLSIDFGQSDYLVDRVFLGGLTYAIRPLRWLQLGVTLGVGVRNYTETRLVAIRMLQSGTTWAPVFNYGSLDTNVWVMYAQFGAIVEPIEGLRFGLSFTTPYARLAGRGRLDLVDAYPVGDGSIGQVDGVISDSAEFYWKQPFVLGFGASYSRPESFTVSLDVKLHGGLDRYTYLEDPSLPSGALKWSKRTPIANVNLGAEVYLTKKLRLRGGFFTNLSALADVNAIQLEEAEGERLHYLGFTVGGSLRTSKASQLSFSTQFQVGFGDTSFSVIDASGDAVSPLTVRQQLASADDLSLIFSIGGSVDLL
jgi:hypothetical protein